MKISLSLFALSLFAFIVSCYIENTNQTTTRYSDGGWTRHYTIPRKKRALANLIMFISGILAVGGILGLIWLAN